MAKLKKVDRVLYFIKGTSATPEETEDAERFAGHVVCFRNAHLVQDDGALEAFDRVAGSVPERYQVAAEEQGDPEARQRPKASADSLPATDGPTTPGKPWKPNT